MRLPIFILSCGLITFSQTALSAKFDYGQKVVSSDAVEGVVTDIRGDKYQLEVTYFYGNYVVYDGGACTGNKRLRSSDIGEKIWVPEYCLKDPIAEKAQQAAAKAQQVAQAEADRKARIEKDKNDKDAAIKNANKMTPEKRIAQEKLGIVEHEGLTWMKCYYGQEWDGNTCIGKPKIISSKDEALEIIRNQPQISFAGYSDWRIPTAPELSSIWACKNFTVKGHSAPDNPRVIDKRYDQGNVYKCQENTPANFWYDRSLEANTMPPHFDKTKFYSYDNNCTLSSDIYDGSILVFNFGVDLKSNPRGLSTGGTISRFYNKDLNLIRLVRSNQ